MTQGEPSLFMGRTGQKNGASPESRDLSRTPPSPRGGGSMQQRTVSLVCAWHELDGCPCSSRPPNEHGRCVVALTLWIGGNRPASRQKWHRNSSSDLILSAMSPSRPAASS